ncbi:hypothetical protein L218DRAFT_670480 [Marasmius fiardii PR-910]|nr:hypothetical protein L218DRAFT_670480 [Marasmius fiardii PR-910]
MSSRIIFFFLSCFVFFYFSPSSVAVAVASHVQHHLISVLSRFHNRKHTIIGCNT